MVKSHGTIISVMNIFLLKSNWSFWEIIVGRLWLVIATLHKYIASQKWSTKFTLVKLYQNSSQSDKKIHEKMAHLHINKS